MANNYSNDDFDELEQVEGEEILRQKVVRILSSTLERNGVSPDKSEELSNELFDNLDSASLVGEKMEYGKEDINTGQVVKCPEDEAELVRTVTDWTEY